MSLKLSEITAILLSLKQLIVWRLLSLIWSLSIAFHTLILYFCHSLKDHCFYFHELILQRKIYESNNIEEKYILILAVIANILGLFVFNTAVYTFINDMHVC